MSGLGDMGNLLKQAQEMQRQIDRVRIELHNQVVTGNAGGGVVRIMISADREEVKGVEVSSDFAKQNPPEAVAELVQRAMQDALGKARDLEREQIGQVTGGMQLPGLF
jgi:DNA-binding YbaB/EbfC family protein